MRLGEAFSACAFLKKSINIRVYQTIPCLRCNYHNLDPIIEEKLRREAYISPFSGDCPYVIIDFLTLSV